MTDRPKIVKDVDLTTDESKLDRVGKPMGVEHRDAGQAEHRPQEQAKSHTLGDMSADYEFFTTGVIHAVTPFERDPVTEYTRVYPSSIQEEMPLTIDHSEPFFAGLGVCLVAGTPINMDRRIYAIIRDRWLELRDMIAGIAMMERKSGFYARTHFSEIEIVDPFALKQKSVIDKLPTVPVTVFGVSSNRSFAYIDPRNYPEPPTLLVQSPKEDMVVEGNNVLGPPPSPEHLMRSEDET